MSFHFSVCCCSPSGSSPLEVSPSCGFEVRWVDGVTGAYDVTATGGDLAGRNATVTLSFKDSQNIQMSGTALTNTTPTGTNDNTYVLENARAPDPPTTLTATAKGTRLIDLAWYAPDDNGGSAITSYKIEVSSDRGNTWTVQVANTRSTTTT